MTALHEDGVPEWDLADRLRKALRQAGMTPGQMADYLEMHSNSIGAWINGRAKPRPATLRVWAMRCGVPYEWLRDGEVRRQGLEPRTR